MMQVLQFTFQDIFHFAGMLILIMVVGVITILAISEIRGK